MWSLCTLTLHLLFILVSHCVLFQKSLDEEVQKLLSLKAEYKEKTGSDWQPGAPAVKSNASTGGNANAADELNGKIKAQGDKIRKLKADKADKLTLSSEVNALLKLKTEYKTVTGKDWSPDAQPTQPAPPQVAQSSADDLIRQIAEQGDKVRKLKAEKADKAAVTAEVNALLKLKTEFKSVTGKDWSPNAQPTTPAKSESPAKSSAGDELNKEIADQGDKVRKLKEAKASKDEVNAQVQVLLALKKDYKEATGSEWKPSTENKSSSKESQSKSVANSPEKSQTPTAKSSSPPASAPPGNNILIQIAAQGDKVRALKSAKASKNTIDEEVSTLKTLKQNYKNVTGVEWKPEFKPVVPENDPPSGQKDSPVAAQTNNSATMDIKAQLTEQVTAQGNLVRDLKAAGKDKAEVDEAVKKLLALKEEYHAKTGEHFPAQGNF